MAELVAVLLITAILTAATSSAATWSGPRTRRPAGGPRARPCTTTPARSAPCWGAGSPDRPRWRRAGTCAAVAGARTAKRAGQRATTTAGRRWQARHGTGPGGSGGPGGGRSPAGNGTAPGGGNPGKPGSGTGSTGTGPGPAGGTSQTAPAAPPGGASPQTPTPAGSGTDPAPASTPTTATAPAGAERSTTSMSTRFAINLEHPTTDGEFLESCVQLGDALKSLADQIEQWADGLSALNLPRSVLTPLHQVSEGITDAADGATQAATAFENEFEDARDVASRGMTITGQDAA